MNKLIVEVYQSKAIRLTCKRLMGDDWLDLLHDLIIKLQSKDLEAIHAKGHVLAYANRTAFNMAMDRLKQMQDVELKEQEPEPNETASTACLADYENAIEAMKQGSRRERILAEVVCLVIKHKSVKKVSELTDVPVRTLNHYINEFRNKAKDSHLI